MKSNQRLGKIKETIIFGRLLRASLGATAVFALTFVFAPYIMAEANAATTSANVAWGAVDLLLDPDTAATDVAVDAAAELARAGHGNVDFGSIVPTVKNADTGDYGTLVVVKKTIGVTTRGKYYTVYLSMSSDATNQHLNLTGAESSSMKIYATDGTWDTPKTLAENGKSGWGYMVPETTVKQSDGATASYFSTLTQSGTNTTFPSSKLNTGLSSSDGSAYTASKWAAVPASSTPQQIWKKTTNTNFSARDTFNVYYGVNVDTDIMSGEYSNEVVYTAIASAASLDTVSENLSRNVRFGTAGNTETIMFDLAQSVEGIITEDDIHVYMVPHNTMASQSVSFNPANLSASDKTAAEAMECTIVANSFETVEVTATGAEGTTSQVRCQLPAGTVADADSTTKGDGAYDFWLTIGGFNYNYVSKVNGGAEPGFVYAGLQSVDDSGNRYVTEMQEMTAGVCRNTNRWDNGLGTAAKLYTPTASTAAPDSGTEISTSLYAISTSPSATDAGSFALKDTRDGKRYVVRRLADGNCWMSQNLNLDLYDGMTLSKDDTNLTSRDNWVITSSSSSNDEKTMGSTQGYGSLSWVANAGSTSTAWQTAHGVETVTLTRYTNDGSDWQESIIAQCSDGTQQAPCYATRTDTANKYYKIATAADVSASRAATTKKIRR